MAVERQRQVTPKPGGWLALAHRADLKGQACMQAQSLLCHGVVRCKAQLPFDIWGGAERWMKLAQIGPDNPERRARGIDPKAPGYAPCDLWMLRYVMDLADTGSLTDSAQRRLVVRLRRLERRYKLLSFVAGTADLNQNNEENLKRLFPLAVIISELVRLDVARMGLVAIDDDQADADTRIDRLCERFGVTLAHLRRVMPKCWGPHSLHFVQRDIELLRQKQDREDYWRILRHVAASIWETEHNFLIRDRCQDVLFYTAHLVIKYGVPPDAPQLLEVLRDIWTLIPPDIVASYVEFTPRHTVDPSRDPELDVRLRVDDKMRREKSEAIRAVWGALERAGRPEPPPEPEPDDESPTVDVRAVNRLLTGEVVVMFGGDVREPQRLKIERAFGLKELRWIETRETDSSTGRIESAVIRPEVTLVIRLIRFVRHGQDVNDLCKRFGKPIVNQERGYGVNQLASSILDQAGDVLRERRG